MAITMRVKMCLALSIPVIFMVIICLSSLSLSSFVSLQDLDDFLREQHINKELEYLQRDLNLLKSHIKQNMINVIQEKQIIENYYQKLINDEVILDNSVGIDQAKPIQEQLDKLFYKFPNIPQNTDTNNKWVWTHPTIEKISDVIKQQDQYYIYKQLESIMGYTKMAASQTLRIKDLKSEKLYEDHLIQPQYGYGFRFQGNDNIDPNLNEFTVYYPYSNTTDFQKKIISQNTKDCPLKDPPPSYFFQSICPNIADGYLYQLSSEGDYLDLGFAGKTQQYKTQKNQKIFQAFGVVDNQNLYNLIHNSYIENLIDSSSSHIAGEKYITIFQNDEQKSTLLFVSHKKSSTEQEAHSAQHKQETINKYTQFQSFIDTNFGNDKKNTQSIKIRIQEYFNNIEKKVQSINESGKSERFLTDHISVQFSGQKYYIFLIPIEVRVFDTAMGVFQAPLENLKGMLNSIENNDSDDQLDDEIYMTQFTCKEMKVLITSIICLVNDIKFSNQLFTENDATTLLRLSKAKLRYNHNENLSGVGICCNNIANIHLKNGRYSEAVSEYQESILMAKIEYKECNQILKRDFKEKSQFQNQYKELKQLKKQQNMSQKLSNSQNNNFKINNSEYKSPEANNNSIGNNSNPNKFTNNKNTDYNMESSQKIDKFSYYQDGQCEDQQTPQVEDELDYRLAQEFPECEDLIYKRNHAKINMLNRKFQLGVALFYYAAKEKDVNFLPQAVELFNQCIKISESQKLSNQNRSNLVRRILILQKLAYCNVQLLEINEATKIIQKAKDTFQRLQELPLQEEHSPPNRDFLDIFHNIPDDVINSYIQYTDSIIKMVNFDFKTAAETLTDIISESNKYDTMIREQTLELLQTIFLNCLDKQSAQLLTSLLQRFKLQIIDIIFMIDYSARMSDEQIKKSHTIAKDIFDQLLPDDNLGFIVFNDSVHECFQIQNKKKYQDLLEKKVRTIMLVPGGDSDLSKGLTEGSTYFEKKEGIKLEQEELKIIQGQKTRYLILFTEGDYSLSEQQKHTIGVLFQHRQVHLLIANISNQNQHMLNLQKLTQLTDKSQFFPGDNEIPEFIQQLREQNTKQQFVYEYLS